MSFNQEEAKQVHHRATMALNYVTRVKEGKLVLAEQGGIERLIDMVNDPENTTQGKAVALAILWNEVYEAKNKEMMMKHGVLHMVREYSNPIAGTKEKARNDDGVKSCYFLTSHLSYMFPEEVNECGIVDIALVKLRELPTPLPVSLLQYVEGACRLLDTISMSEKTRASMTERTERQTVETLLHVLAAVQQGTESDNHSSFSATTEKEGPPRDAFKMRAGAALNWLASPPEPDAATGDRNPNLVLSAQTVEGSVRSFLDSMDSTLGDIGRTLVWFTVQPVLRPLIRLELFDVLTSSLSTHASYDHCIALIAKISTLNELNQLLNTEVQNEEEATGVLAMKDYLLTMFDDVGSRLCSRWAILCQSLIQEGLANIIIEGYTGSSECDKFMEALVVKLVRWLQGGHPYKGDAAKLLQILVKNKHLGVIGNQAISETLHMLSENTLKTKETATSSDEAMVAYLHIAITEMSRQ